MACLGVSRLLLLLALACPFGLASSRTLPPSQVAGAGATEGCDAREVHLALAGPGQVRLQWRTDAPGCPTSVTYYPAVSSSSSAAAAAARASSSGGGGSPPRGHATGSSSTLTETNMCEAPAKSTPFRVVMHSALLEGLESDREYVYVIEGDDSERTFDSPLLRPYSSRDDSDNDDDGGSGGSPPRQTFLVFADMGDASKCPGAAATQAALAAEVRRGGISLALHVGDLSYADGHYDRWNTWMEGIEPVSAKVPYMIAIGNHEYDYMNGQQNDPSGSPPYHPSWGNFGTESGGECGVMAAHRFQMPSSAHGRRQGVTAPAVPAASPVAAAAAAAAGGSLLLSRLAAVVAWPWGPKPPPAANPPFWYSFNQGAVHFTVVSSEHDLSPGSDQATWLESDLASVDRCETPWLVFAAHRPMYVVFPHKDNRIVGEHLRGFVEPLLGRYGVDVVVSGHVHSYARSCAVYDDACIGRDTRPLRRRGGRDSDDSDDDDGPSGVVHLTIGTGGHKMSAVEDDNQHWLEASVQQYGYGRVTVSGADSLLFEFVASKSGDVVDSVELEGGRNQECRRQQRRRGQGPSQGSMVATAR